MINRFLTGSGYNEGEAYSRGFYPMFNGPIDASENISAGASRRYEHIKWSDDGRSGDIHVSTDQFSMFREFL